MYYIYNIVEKAKVESNADYKEQGQKHDQGYKRILSNNDSFLHFLQKYIAMPWTADITVDGLERIDKSFVGESYRLY
jgi:hypothetical protein